MKRVTILGATGSIGTQTLDVIRTFNKEEPRFAVVALAAGENHSLLSQQISEFRPKWVSLKHERDLEALRHQLGSLAHGIEFIAGEEGLQVLAAQSDADLVVNGLVGAVGLIPTLTALRAGIDVALANKESLVIGGHLVRDALEQGGAKLIPVDSEHNALFQFFKSCSTEEISRVVLTASGGALRDWPLDKLDNVTSQDVLKHPTWQMGKRITVDSATLVNKAFEVIEAHWLFDFSFERLDVVIHPQSVVHGIVELCDGSVLAHWGAPDMRGPIQYALSYPERSCTPYGKLDWSSLRLEFCSLDKRRYPAFEIVVEAGRKGGAFPAVANAADEVAVQRFLKGEIPFTRIPEILKAALEAHKSVVRPVLEAILEADRWAREYARHV
ncbi:MAG: 1-deoxy-D-xylulose-5-phosphate reductoisomerase [Candidatus Fraserbacteria bacterium RBG_16_55_9]|uniref:1-deoxy-D-xylulose 5-phosphate reductoisomerase n=1 Tax=Fraserbacteria sp. (strain RBG_16_55_9) TaxID=1817864 RepID=A0A1F5UWD9_FRAXR|nr:MAG: 1-deoxy-D-xylulose-5-phosphate reductoisomerase [Candidatus Fraserbacteria bacterium RBG_16_55_9]